VFKVLVIGLINFGICLVKKGAIGPSDLVNVMGKSKDEPRIKRKGAD